MARLTLPSASFGFLTQGAIIQEIKVAGHNLVLSFASSEPYLDAPYFGETVGRVANRIGNGLIEDLNGRSYQLATNQDGRNHLHGGNVGWGKRTFSDPQYTTRDEKSAVLFKYTSPHDDEGYPGTVALQVWYTAYEDDDKRSVLEIEYEAELVGHDCEETVVNVTNHSYFNLGNKSTIDGTEVAVCTNQHLTVDEYGVPTGQITTCAAFEADQKFKLGAAEPVIDNCFVVDNAVGDIPLDTRRRKLRRLVDAFHASTSIHLEVSSTEPSFQLYTGDFVDVAASKSSPARTARSGFCVEPGRFVDAVNMPQWRNQVVLRRGQTWGSKIVYRTWKE